MTAPTFLALALLILVWCAPLAADEIAESAVLGSASMSFDGDRLTVSTGKVARQWQVTGEGLATTWLRNLDTGKRWGGDQPGAQRDWELDPPAQLRGKAHLVALTAEPADDQGFTSRHLRVVATFAYPKTPATVQYVVWAYPDSPGLRTQLQVKKGVADRPGEMDASLGNDDSVILSLDRGKGHIGANMPQSTPAWCAGQARHKRSLLVRASGLQLNAGHTLGFSWWDHDNQNRKSRVRVSSVDGETITEVVPATRLPVWSKDKQQPPAQHTFTLPDGVNLDGQVLVQFDKVSGADTAVCDLWVYGPASTKRPALKGDPARLDQLRRQAPGGLALVAYLDLGAASDKQDKSRPEGIADTLPLSLGGQTVRWIGYYSDTQNRNHRHTPILRDTPVTTAAAGRNDWASVLSLRDGQETLTLVKESHKAVNTPGGGANTGAFEWQAGTVKVTGIGWLPRDLTPEHYRAAWATWTVLASGDDDRRQLAIKRFDRARYPADRERDLYIMANTWGSSVTKIESQAAAREENLLREIASQQDLGIDVQQIDDGWQGVDYNDWYPVKRLSFDADSGRARDLGMTEYDVYPNGWSGVRKAAREAGITLGLWFSVAASAEDLIRNYDQGGFLYYKIDFANLDNMKKVDNLVGRARRLALHSGHRARINWDVTERQPRMGYFFGREYGNIYLENRKPVNPAKVVYKPYLVLRDAWHVARYMNLNKFQITTQNVDRVNRKASDAFKHTHDYCFAQTMMGSPIFFQETQYLDDTAREQLRPLIALYKQHREAMFKGYVFAIGDEPDNRSWSGFQNHDEQAGSGYITMFRQIENRQSSYTTDLKFLAGKKIEVTDLVAGTRRMVKLGSTARLSFDIDEPGEFLFLRYRVVD